MMTARELARLKALAASAKAFSPMSRVALDDMKNPAQIRTALQTALARHLRNKSSIADLVDEIKRVSGMQTARAVRIARTEKTRASNGCRYAQILQEYIDEYELCKREKRKRPDRPIVIWIDPKTAKEPREGHVAMTGTGVPVGTPFPNGLYYPGDPDAPVEEIANCHCYIRRKAGQKWRTDHTPRQIKVADYTFRIPPLGLAQKIAPDVQTATVYRGYPVWVHIRSDRAKVTGVVVAVVQQGRVVSLAVQTDRNGIVYVLANTSGLPAGGVLPGDRITARGKRRDRQTVAADRLIVERRR